MKADQLRALQIYPHLVTKGGGDRNPMTWPVYVSNTPIGVAGKAAENAFIGVGMIDAHGDITPAARDEMRRRFSARARNRGLPACIVWDERSCTWIDGEGACREGRNPPRGQTVNAHHHALLPFLLEDVRSVALPRTLDLPDGTTATHICVVHLRRDFIEISLGEACILADFSDVVHEGEIDPAAEILDADGNIRPLKTYRGAEVTEIDEDGIIHGPVQPIGTGVVVRAAWPDEVRDACTQLLGRDPSKAVFEAVWNAVDPETRGSPWVAEQRAGLRRARRAA